MRNSVEIFVKLPLLPLYGVAFGGGLLGPSEHVSLRAFHGAVRVWSWSWPCPGTRASAPRSLFIVCTQVSFLLLHVSGVFNLFAYQCLCSPLSHLITTIFIHLIEDLDFCEENNT